MFLTFVLLLFYVDVMSMNVKCLCNDVMTVYFYLKDQY